MATIKKIVKKTARKAQNGEGLVPGNMLLEDIPAAGATRTQKEKVRSDDGNYATIKKTRETPAGKKIVAKKRRTIQGILRGAPRMANYKTGGMIKRADGSYSKRGLWDNLRSKAAKNKKSGAKPKAPTKAMLSQEKKIKSKGK